MKSIIRYFVSLLVVMVFPLQVVAADLDLEWVKEEAIKQLTGCRVISSSGVPLHTPDGIGHYKALWTRDFYYMVKYAGNLMEADEIRDSIRYILAGQREDGCIPDRVYANGTAIYSPGGENNPLADHALDNGPFLAMVACEYARAQKDLEFFRKIEPNLRRGLDQINLAGNGLVFNPPDNPQCPYGFTDVVIKTGHLLFSSLLYYEACQQMEDLCRLAGCGEPEEYARRARMIRKNIQLLWNDKDGMFWAADLDCRQIDIWGSAYAVETGIVPDEQVDRISTYLIRHHDQVFQKGQVRHLPGNETWQRTFGERPAGQYQNGAFWATPLPWVVPVVQKRDPHLASQILTDVIKDFQENGTAECVNGDYRKVPDFVVSATNLYAAVRSISQ